MAFLDNAGVEGVGFDLDLLVGFANLDVGRLDRDGHEPDLMDEMRKRVEANDLVE